MATSTASLAWSGGGLFARFALGRFAGDLGIYFRLDLVAVLRKPRKEEMQPRERHTVPLAPLRDAPLAQTGGLNHGFVAAESINDF